MQTLKTAYLRARQNSQHLPVALAAVVFLAWSSTAVDAETNKIRSYQVAALHNGPTYIVKSDRGGYLTDRLKEIRNLRRYGAAVQIQGRVCYSTCTMFLGLPNVCVNPETTFGFHGPSRSGRKLAKKEFDHFSKVMASYYPAPLSEWFMEKGRNKVNGVHKIKGRELVRMGIPSCQNRRS